MANTNGTAEAVENVIRYDGLQGLVLQAGETGNTEVWLGIDLGTSFSVESVEALQGDVTARIDAGKKPAGTLAKSINRIYLHRAQMQDALVTLFTTHSNMVSPSVSRKSAVWKARYSMLDSMSNKVLKMYAADLLPDEVDNYILSDAADRVSLVTKLTTILAEDKEETAVEAE